VIDLNEVSQDKLMEFNRAIAKWTRLSGTPDERAAAEYVAAQMRATGFDVRILEHDAYISLPGKAALRVTVPEKREIRCITHSMGRPTLPQGVDAELVYAGKGEPDDYARAGAAGKFALVEGRATPQHAVNATKAGALGLVCISGRIAHEMCCSPVWGNPSVTTAGTLPTVHLISVDKADGESLRELCRQGRVAIHTAAEVQTAWTTTPIVQADLAPGHAAAEKTFVMLSGHLDSWYLGAMDNGSANACMMEVARLMAAHRSAMRRGLRVAMWSGHSHGRYSSSAWYADTFFVELDERCVAHVNTDALGGINADTFSTNSMSETAALAVNATRRVAQAPMDAHRVGRNSDQSFHGVGIPSILGVISVQADGGTGWWWHTPHDTIDKIDPVRLRRDTCIFLDVVERLCTEAVLPLDYAASAADIKQSLDALAQAARGRFDLTEPINEATRLEALCRKLNDAAHTAGASAANINRCLQQLGRTLIPVTYTRAGRHAHDPALEVPFLPKLQAVRDLAAASAGSDSAKLLQVDLNRGRSELTSALRRACGAVETCLSSTP
jgi:hypothetical protein